MTINTIACDWAECPVVARFHIQVALNRQGQLVSTGGPRLPFSHSHHNICGAHLDEFSAKIPPLAIYAVGKCPHCDPA